MTTEHHRETARIYTFPARPSSKVDVRGAETAAIVNLWSRRAVAHVCIDAWYHDEAIAAASAEKLS